MCLGLREESICLLATNGSNLSDKLLGATLVQSRAENSLEPIRPSSVSFSLSKKLEVEK